MKYSELFCGARKRQVIKFVQQMIIASPLILIAMTGSPVFQGHAESKVPVITIHARRYEFKPSAITLKVGQPVKLVFISDDVAHGISVEGILSDVNIKRDKPIEIEIIPPKVGDFAGECSSYCGMGHDRMKFLIHVVPDAAGQR